MPTTVEYALMAGASYISTRADVNLFPIPQGWTKIIDPTDSHANIPGSGFEAISFKNSLTNEIVISFAGTGPGLFSTFPYLTEDWQTNLALGTGNESQQLLQAAQYYLQIRGENPDARIRFTGDSLGGGLAALLAVFFDKTAVTFEPAPFAASAKEAMRDYLLSNISTLGFNLAQLVDLATLSAFNEGNKALRAGNVTGLSVAGEALSLLASAPLINRIGLQNPSLELSANGVSIVQLHSQALITAFLQSNQSAASGGNPQQTLSEVTKKLTDLMAMIYDPKLYAFSTASSNDKNVNFLEHLVRHEAGNAPLPNGGTVVADAMLTRFTADLWKIAQDGGLSINESNWTGDCLQ